MEREDVVFKLPATVISKVDLGRLLRELEAVDNFLLQAGAQGHKTSLILPKTSRTLEVIVEQNELKLLDKEDRVVVKQKLETLRKDAPVVHMSFSAEPPAVFLQKIITWFRKEIHPDLLLDIGLQPDIAAGCVLRTNNRYFDFSLRKNLYQKRGVLAEAIKTKAKG